MWDSLSYIYSYKNKQINSYGTCGKEYVFVLWKNSNIIVIIPYKMFYIKA